MQGELREGDRIGGYRIVRPLGKGGMGCVYEVEHEKLGVRYALKTFTLDHGAVDLLRRRFLVEGKILARLRHPNLVRVYDLDYDAITGTPYFVMDLVLNRQGEPETMDDKSWKRLMFPLEWSKESQKKRELEAAEEERRVAHEERGSFQRIPSFSDIMRK